MKSFKARFDVGAIIPSNGVTSDCFKRNPQFINHSPTYNVNLAPYKEQNLKLRYYEPV